MEIGLKWEKFDSDPGSLLRLLGSQIITQPVADPMSGAKSVYAAPQKNSMGEPKIYVQPAQETSIMDDWMIDPVSMFEEDVPMSKHMLVPA